jgi:MoaA/NifB/PqqE/SkfB family radical SAM enzyme
LTIDEIKVVADNLKKIGVGTIVLTGGEPFIRKDLPDIIKAFSQRGLIVRVQTNGILVTEESLKACFKSGLDFLTVSLDSLDENKFDSLCGHKGLWQNAVNTIKMGAKLNPKALNIVNTVVSRHNIDELSEIVKFVDACGAYASLVPVHIAEKNLIRSNDNTMQFTQEDIPRIKKSYEEIFRLKKQGLKIGSSLKYLKDSLNYLLTGDYKWNCDAGSLYFIIFDNGNISMCDEFEGIDTERGRNIAKIYSSGSFKNACKKMKSACGGCIWGCWRETSLLIKSNQVIFERIKTFLSR